MELRKLTSGGLWRLGLPILSLTFFALGNAHAAKNSNGVQPDSTNRLIVKFNDRADAKAASFIPYRALIAKDKKSLAAALSTHTGLQLTHRRSIATGADVFSLPSWAKNANLERIAANLSADPRIEYAEPDRMMYPLFTPNDSRYNEQWHYFETTGGLNLPGVWDTYNGAGVVAAVIDTGYRPHADLVANILPGYDMISDTSVSVDGNERDSDATDPGDYSAAGECGAGQPARNSSWHGTHVAGTIAAVTNNGSGVAGVAFGGNVVPVRVLGRCGGFTSDIADGMIWASGGSVNGVPGNANPAQVLNLSLGGGGSCSSTSQNAINIARGNGATVVVAAGNSNTNASNSNPANCAGVVAVAATDRGGNKASYSNFGSVVDVAAPGGETGGGAENGVLSTLNSGRQNPGSDSYAFYQGTSMAAPHVAGLAALLYQVKPSATPNEVETAIKTSARAFPGSCRQCGTGIADAAAAVAALDGDTPPPPGDSVLENGVPEKDLAASRGQGLEYTLEVPAGTGNLSFQISGGRGDADLYVRFGAAPTSRTYDCRPYLNGNNETCNISNVQGGTYHVLVQAFRSFSGVTLIANYDEPGGG